MINLTLSEGTPKTNAQIVTTIELKLAEQPNGVVSFVETAVVAGLCNDDTLKWTDPCYDMDFPCDSNHCLVAGNHTVIRVNPLNRLVQFNLKTWIATYSYCGDNCD